MNFTVTAIDVELGTIASEVELTYTISGSALEFYYEDQAITAPNVTLNTAPQGFDFQPQLKIAYANGTEPEWLTYSIVDVEEGEPFQVLCSVFTDVLEDRGRHLLGVYLTSPFPKFVFPSSQAYEGVVPFRVEIWESGFVKPKNYAPLFEPAFKTSDSKIVGEDW